MGMRNILILFFSAMAVSLVILILFFSLFFKNFDDVITFDTKIPESAPELKGYYDNGKLPTDSKASGVARSTINVPPDARPQTPSKDPVVGAGVNPGEEESLDNAPLLEESDPQDALPNELAPLKPEATTAPLKEKKPAPPSLDHDGIAPKLTPALPKAAPPAPKQEPPKETGTAPKTGTYQVYLDGFSSPEAAQNSLETLRSQGQTPLIKQKNGKTVIQLGTFSNKDYAESLAGRTGAKVKTTTP